MNIIKSITLTALLIVISVFAIKATLMASVSEDMVTVKGIFTDITRPNVKLKAEDGNEYLVHLGPVWYWEDNNYSLTLNSQAEVYGNLDPGTKDIFAHKITIDGKTIMLTDDNGKPLWWNDSKGRNKGNGWGMGYGRGGRCSKWK